MTEPSSLTLYDYWRSGAGYRVRIALNLKGISYTRVPVDLRAGEQRSSAYRTIAPQGLVPALVADDLVLTQSTAIMEWLDEQWPTPPLLPVEPEQRAIVRSMAALITCDIHPLNNLRVLQSLRKDLQAGETQVAQWIGRWITDGFEALEVMIQKYGRGCAFGDTPTLVDCCLIPQVYSAERFSVDLSAFPALREAVSTALALEPIQAAHPDQQSDVN